MSTYQPVYIQTYHSGALEEKKKNAFRILESCTLCPRKCKVNRLSGQIGVCRTDELALLSSFNAHFGEETPLVGENGSGTLFFTHCNLLCIFCQNYDISHLGQGEEVTPSQLAGVMLHLQNIGCHNINFVTPSHVIPQILAALEIAVEKGLSVPLVYNSGGFDRVSTLKLLNGVFDIYMPDFKFWNPETAGKYCDAENYPEVAKQGLMEMHRQVGDLVLNEKGIAERGLLVRHLVMPGMGEETRRIMRFISNRISADTYVNIMPQYRPCGRADEMAEIADALSMKDYQEALTAAEEEGLRRLDQRRRVFIIR
jgi:putative pyruvate formate lyase activating enzyme